MCSQECGSCYKIPTYFFCCTLLYTFLHVYSVICKLQLEQANMMTGIADSNAKLVSQLNVIIDIQNWKINTERSQNQNPTRPVIRP